MRRFTKIALVCLFAAVLSISGIMLAGSFNEKTPAVSSLNVGPAVSYTDNSTWSNYIVNKSRTGYSGGDGLSTATAYKISNTDDFALMAYRVNMGLDATGRYYELTTDLNLSLHYWMPIGNYRSTDSSINKASKTFNGYFDGKGYTISGIYIGNPDNTPSVISSTLNYAGLFGYASGRIENLNLECFIQNTGSYIGGFAGYASNLTLNKCIVVSGSKVKSALTGSSQIGGLVGQNTGTISFTYCANRANITTTGGPSYQCRTGGLIAYANTATIKCSGNYGNIIASSGLSVGGLAAYTSGAITIDSCFNEGNFTVTNTTVTYGDIGGLIGWATDTYTITNCYNSGNIYIQGTPGSTSSGYSGIVGWGGSSTSLIKNCFTSGNIIINNTISSVGIFCGSGSPTIESCYYKGDADFRRNGASLTNPNSGSKITRITNSITRTTTTDLTMDLTNYTVQQFINLLNQNKGDGAEWILDGDGFPTLNISGISENNGTVIFDYNYTGAIPDRITVTKALGQTNTIDSSDMAEPSRTAYNFIKWTENQNGSGSVWYKYLNGEFVDNQNRSVTIDSLDGKTLYAQWEPIEYILEIDNSNETYNATMENKDITISADVISAGFMYWEVWDSLKDNGDGSIGGWVRKYEDKFSSETLNIAEILDDSLIEAYAYNDGAGMRIKFRAAFANENTVINKLTIKSNWQSFGTIKINGGENLSPNVTGRYEYGSTINIVAEAEKYYAFVSYNINGSDIKNPAYSFTITQDTTISVTFERREYNIVISSQYAESGIPTPASDLANLSKYKFRIDDAIQITYKTDVDGYCFSSVLYKTSGAIVEDIDDSGYLKITKDILERYLDGDGYLRIVVEYLEQYAFSVNFDDPVMRDYCVLIVNNRISDGGDNSYSDRIYPNEMYYLDKNTDVIIQFELKEGYKVISIRSSNQSGDGLSQSEIDNLLNGELILTDISKIWTININIAPIEYIINLNAKWIDGGKFIEGIGFLPGNSFMAEYNGRTDSIVKSDVSGYRFLDWFIYHWESGKWIKLDPKYIKEDNNLNPLDSIDLKSAGYIDEFGNIEIIAAYIPVYTLTINVKGQGSYKVEINNEEKNITSGQFDYGTKIKIKVNKSTYIKFINNGPQTFTEENGQYILTINSMDSDCNISFDFESITKTFNVVKELNGAKGSLNLNTSGVLSGNELKVNLNDTLSFTFDIKSGNKLKEWTVNGLTVDEMIEKNYASYSGNVLRLNLNDETLDWLTGAGEIEITVKTIFNPLITAAIIAGSIIIVALLIFIILYMIAADKKKKQIQEAIKSGIIGAARFKTDFHENID